MVLDESTVEGLKASLRGPLLLPWRCRLRRGPQHLECHVDKRRVIARCAGVADVIAVNFARAHSAGRCAVVGITSRATACATAA